MSNTYREMNFNALMEEWCALRDKVLSGDRSQRNLDRLGVLRREIDRRKGEKNPTVDVNFEDYVKD